MAPTTPTIRGDRLTYREGDAERMLVVGTPAWYAWLADATAFALVADAGGFTARKERAGSGRGGWYWKAYRKRDGRLRRAYLGKAAGLTPARLAAIAARLAADPAVAAATRSRTAPAAPRAAAAPPPAELLLRTKLFAPAPRLGAVPRPRLVARLAAGLRGPLTLLAAPAGSGKTTLLAAWRAASPGGDTPLAWVALDAGDNDPARFWRYVAAALGTLHPGVGDEALALLRAPQPPPLAGVLTVLLNALAALPADAVLVLDDYHVIATPTIHAGLAFLLDHLPPRLHLAIATRADPPLPLARLRARGALAELRAADLRFSRDEAAALLNGAPGPALAAGEVDTLAARTEGWAAGLQLAALALRGQDPDRRAAAVAAFGGSDRHVGDYLVEEVLERQPPAVRRFLLRTAILDRLCGPLCDAVAPPADGQPDGQAMLEALDGANLFVVPLDGERRWYRYHQLFAELLRLRLARELPGGGADLHRRASAWCAAAGLLDAAVGHALAAPDPTLAAALVERHAPPLLRRSEVLLVRDWLVRLPAALVAARPRLALTHGWTLALTGDFAAVDRLLARAAGWPPALGAEAALLAANVARFRGDAPRALALSARALALVADAAPAHDDAAGGMRAADARAGALLIRGVALSARGDLAAAARALDEAGRPTEAGGWGRYVALVALEELALLEGERGRLGAAIRTCARADALAAPPGGAALPAAGLVAIALGEALGERGDLDGAEAALGRGVALVRGAGEPLALARGHGALARVRQARGDPAGALATLARGEAWLAHLGDPSAAARARLAAHRARLWLAQGRLAAAEDWARDAAGVPDDAPASFEHLTLVRLRLARGRRDPADPDIPEALATLGRLLAAAEATGRAGHALEILLLEALARQVAGDPARAALALGRALALAAPEGHVRLFLDEGAPLAALLARWLATERARGADPPERAARAHARRLLAAAPPASAADAGGGGPRAAPLTPRELAVLRLMAAGLSNGEIAARLFVAVGSVKSYVNRLFGKLAVTSRTQAVAHARELGLLGD
jgi:LuxR family maltose regulon positive regulatory protein